MSNKFEITNPVWDRVYDAYAWRDNNRILVLVQGEGITIPGGTGANATVTAFRAKAPRFQLKDDRGVIDLSSGNPDLSWAIRRPDGSEDIVACNIVVDSNTGITAADGIIEIPITASATRYAGDVYGEIRLITSNGTTKFFGIDAKIGKGVSDNAAAQSTQYSALLAALQELVLLKSASSGEIAQLDTLVNGELPTNGTNPVASGVLKEYLLNRFSNVTTVYNDELDTEDKNDIVYIHRIGNSSSSYVKGLVIVSGDGHNHPYQGCTQYRFRKSGTIEYRTGTLESSANHTYDWGDYTASGDWIRIESRDSMDTADFTNDNAHYPSSKLVKEKLKYKITNNWIGKRYISHGDSITWYNGHAYQSGEHQGETAKGYQSVLVEQLGVQLNSNKGVSGIGMVKIGSRRSGVDIITGTGGESTVDYTDYDLCTIAFGTNDFRHSIPLGDIGVIGDSTFDTSTFYGAYRTSIEYILDNNPGIHLVLITPAQQSNVSSGTTYDVNTVNSAGHKLIDYVNAIKRLGEMYGLKVCDMYGCSGITDLTLDELTIDGLHPNDAGFDRMGKLLAGLLSGGISSSSGFSEGDLLQFKTSVAIATLSSSSWNNGSQSIDVSSVYDLTPNTKVDIEIDDINFGTLQSSGCFGIHLETDTHNNTTTLSAKVLGSIPSSDIEIQLIFSEINNLGEIGGGDS